MSAVMTPATIRGKAAFDEVRDLFDQLANVDAHIEGLVTDKIVWSGPFGLTNEEMLDVLHRRREVITNKLENKGIRIAPDPLPVAEAA